MADMLVNLLKLPPQEELLSRLEQEGIRIHRALAPDKLRVVDWVAQHSSRNAAGEADVCFSRTPVTCYLATRGADILGYACYDATAPNFFGPTRVLESEQGKGIGKALLLKSLYGMREAGYVYAIIGGVGPAEFYEKAVGAIRIPDSTPGIYRDFLGAKTR
ncbi:GNAT family N-acetyltransferase [Cohnella cholangitidis]|uniref:GNAT family N-acetyltransferase n=1 Tax=Cohnella cholangitidis TaxID=2598458 RepID=A0A7G5C354_9BACL|nr:GNAT family N-acetyltransferase [Cohnella cholangitidis]QMV43638.1 GNAT family N-acetyltransferase [Cohnella cholangitidis]